MRYFWIPDLHGELDMAAGLLQQEGILDSNWERIDNETVTGQMGDFLNCVVESVGNDNRCLDHSEWFDILLVGNHEDPYFGGPAFNGFWKDPVLTHRLRLLESAGRYKMMVNCDGVLVSHAGITNELYNKYWKYDGNNPQKLADEINKLRSSDPNHEIFTAIGWDRGGWGRSGGILWADWSQYLASQLKQLVGHSVGEGVRLQSEGKKHAFGRISTYKKPTPNWEAICIDLGAGKHSDTIVGAWIEEGNVRLVSYTM